MNGYIINPAWFYWVNVATGIKIVAIVSACMSLIACIPLAITVYGEEDDDYLKLLRVTMVVAVLSILGAIFVPTKETLIEMQVAKYATWENAEWTVDAVKDAVDYIVNAIGSLK